MALPPMVKLAAQMGQIVAEVKEQSKWLHWLAEIGYGIDFSSDVLPPCTPRQLAEVLAEREPLGEEDDVECWLWCIEENTGWGAK